MRTTNSRDRGDNRCSASEAGAFADAYGADIRWTRLAVTEEQVISMNLPAAPPETTDGRLVVQAEAIPPRALARLVRRALVERLDLQVMRRVKCRTRAARAHAVEVRDGTEWSRLDR